MRMGMAARRPPARTPSSKSLASPQKPKAIKHLSRSLTRTCAPARNVLCHQGDALAVTRATGHDGLRHGQVEGDRFSGARLVSSARVPDFSTDSLLPPNAPYGPPSSLSFPFDESRINDSQCSFHSCSFTNQGRGDRRSSGEAPRRAQQCAQPRGPRLW